MTDAAASAPPRFAHQAMGTIFEVLIAGESASYASQAASAVFAEIDHLERLFSRFDPASDIARIGRLGPGEILAVAPETYECLAAAEEARRDTGGAFDVNVRGIWQAGMRGSKADPGALAASEGPLVSAAGLAFALERTERGFAVRRGSDPAGYALDLDLGGIGKGYALDRAIDMLREWGIENVLIHGGTSSARAAGTAPGTPGGWPVGIGGGWPGAPKRLLLSGGAVGGSGTEVKGEHILDPRTGLPARGHLAAWAIHLSAARADALSTAFMVMDTDAVASFCAARPDTGACVVVAYGDVRVFNPKSLEVLPD